MKLHMLITLTAILIYLTLTSCSALPDEYVHCRLSGVQCMDITIHSEDGSVLGTRHVR